MGPLAAPVLPAAHTVAQTQGRPSLLQLDVKLSPGRAVSTLWAAGCRQTLPRALWTGSQVSRADAPWEAALRVGTPWGYRGGGGGAQGPTPTRLLVVESVPERPMQATAFLWTTWAGERNQPSGPAAEMRAPGHSLWAMWGRVPGPLPVGKAGPGPALGPGRKRRRALGGCCRRGSGGARRPSGVSRQGRGSWPGAQATEGGPADR